MLLELQRPVSVRVDTFGTSKVNETDIENAVTENFKLTPNGIIEFLGLRNPIYRKTSYHGHFGRNDVSWEMVDENKKQILRNLNKMADEKEKILLYDAIDSSILKSIPNPSKEPYEIKVKVLMSLHFLV